MPSIRVTVPVAAPVEVVYHYLLERYGRHAHCATSHATKGFIPNVRCREADEPYYLRFSVAAYDAWLNIAVSGWQWEYDLQEVTANTSEVTICYRWSWWLSLLALGTVRHQAANEMVETAMALDALGWDQRFAPPSTLAETPVPSAEAIREPRRPTR